MEAVIDHAAFAAMLRGCLPEVAAEIDQYNCGLLSGEMAVIARCTNAAVEAGDWDAVRRHYAFLEQISRAADPDVDNALKAAYLEHLPLWEGGSDPPEVRALLPTGLAGLLWDMEGREFQWPRVPRPS